MRRIESRTILTSVLAGALLTGCGGPSDPTGPAATSSVAISPTGPGPSAAVVDPEVISEAAKKTLGQPLIMTVGMTIAGQTVTMRAESDPGIELMRLTMKMPEKAEVLRAGKFVYFRDDDPKSGWVRLDIDKLRPDSEFRRAFDLTANLGILGGVVEIRETAPGSYTGSADLTRAFAAAVAADKQGLAALRQLGGGDGAATGQPGSAFSTVATSVGSSGVVCGANLASTWPPGATRNFSKFQRMSPVYPSASGVSTSDPYSGCRFSPLTSTFSVNGNVTP